MKKIFFAIAAIAMAFTGCSNEDEIINEETAKQPLKFNFNITCADGTRTIKTQWENDDVIYLLFDASTNYASGKYMTLTYNNGEWTPAYCGTISGKEMTEEDINSEGGTLSAVYVGTSENCSEPVYTKKEKPVSTLKFKNTLFECRRADTGKPISFYRSGLTMVAENVEYTNADGVVSASITLVKKTSLDNLISLSITGLSTEKSWGLLNNIQVSQISAVQCLYFDNSGSVLFNGQTGNDYAVLGNNNTDDFTFFFGHPTATNTDLTLTLFELDADSKTNTAIYTRTITGKDITGDMAVKIKGPAATLQVGDEPSNGWTRTK